MQKNIKKILLTGGGTGGSVAPLLAISDVGCRMSDVGKFKFTWIGTRNGVEKQMVQKENIKFISIASGKFRRYFSIKNFIDLFKIIFAFFQSLAILIKEKPALVMSAGSFASVPVVWAAWLLRVPVLIHQQDVRHGLANKLMAPFANVITVTFEKSLADYGKKAVWTGNPAQNTKTRKHENTKTRKHENTKTQEIFNFKNDLPVVLAVGGGTGALAINELIEKNLEELTQFCNIIHITGKNKKIQYFKSLRVTRYALREFLNAEQMSQAYAAADIAVSRAGMGVLTELSYLGKPAILIPMPDSHQEDNAEIFKEKQAAIVLNQKELTAEKLVENIKKLLNNRKLQNKLSSNIKTVIKKGANDRIVEIINNIIKKK
ncbi:undecaprenyldiphospho-muramoylpentapeptide beta-N-acetylglucosaminyltransferase [Candidatus Parcubacteria bacterium]|nr:undecaprenyldiphospho-muramoylpentapeptide beta-N-acetylglucosaminyltransferase [Candidatus Parcubacteria bacterium]